MKYRLPFRGQAPSAAAEQSPAVHPEGSLRLQMGTQPAILAVCHFMLGLRPPRKVLAGFTVGANPPIRPWTHQPSRVGQRTRPIRTLNASAWPASERNPPSAPWTHRPWPASEQTPIRTFDASAGPGVGQTAHPHSTHRLWPASGQIAHPTFDASVLARASERATPIHPHAGCGQRRGKAFATAPWTHQPWPASGQTAHPRSTHRPGPASEQSHQPAPLRRASARRRRSKAAIRTFDASARGQRRAKKLPPSAPWMHRRWPASEAEETAPSTRWMHRSGPASGQTTPIRTLDASAVASVGAERRRPSGQMHRSGPASNKPPIRTFDASAVAGGAQPPIRTVPVAIEEPRKGDGPDIGATFL
jgi:hypothetical protein